MNTFNLHKTRSNLSVELKTQSATSTASTSTAETVTVVRGRVKLEDKPETFNQVGGAPRYSGGGERVLPPIDSPKLDYSVRTTCDNCVGAFADSNSDNIYLSILRSSVTYILKAEFLW